MTQNYCDLPKTALEILKITFIASRPINSIEISKMLQKRGIDVDSRTVRYHLKHLEELNLTTKIGKKGCIVTPEGIRQLKRIMVYERLGTPSTEVEKLIVGSTFNLESGRGTVLANIAILPKEYVERAYEILTLVSSLNFFPSPLLAVKDENEKLGSYEVPDGYIGFGCVSATIYDAILRKKGVYVESIAAGVYEVKDNKPLGFVELVTHTGATLSPGELFIKAGYTSLNEIVKTGSGYVTAAIKRFSSFFSDIVEETVRQINESGIDGLIELSAVTPETEKIDVSDANKGRLIVFGGGNYFAPLIELGLDVQLTINGTLIDVKHMKTPDQILK